MTAQSRGEPKAVQDCHNLLLWLIPHLDQFPRLRRFTLGERIENQVLEVLDYLVTAAWSRNKAPLLAHANRRLEVARHLWRLAYELEVIPLRRFEHGARLMDEIGRQIGGWQKTQQASP